MRIKEINTMKFLTQYLAYNKYSINLDINITKL